MIKGCQHIDYYHFYWHVVTVAAIKATVVNLLQILLGIFFFCTFLKDSWLSLETLNPSPSTILLNRIAIDAASFIHFFLLSRKFLHRSCNSSMLRYRIFVVESTEVLLSRPCDSDPLNQYVERFFLIFLHSLHKSSPATR